MSRSARLGQQRLRVVSWVDYDPARNVQNLVLGSASFGGMVDQIRASLREAGWAAGHGSTGSQYSRSAEISDGPASPGPARLVRQLRGGEDRLHESILAAQRAGIDDEEIARVTGLSVSMIRGVLRSS